MSANLGLMLRRKLNEAAEMGTGGKPRLFEEAVDIELRVLQPLFALQSTLSKVPAENELLIEQIETKDGFHLFVYPFEGLSPILVMLGAAIFLKEKLTLRTWLGILLIGSGVALVSAS